MFDFMPVVASCEYIVERKYATSSVNVVENFVTLCDNNRGCPVLTKFQNEFAEIKNHFACLSKITGIDYRAAVTEAISKLTENAAAAVAEYREKNLNWAPNMDLLTFDEKKRLLSIARQTIVACSASAVGYTEEEKTAFTNKVKALRPEVEKSVPVDIINRLLSIDGRAPGANKKASVELLTDAEVFGLQTAMVTITTDKKMANLDNIDEFDI